MRDRFEQPAWHSHHRQELVRCDAAFLDFVLGTQALFRPHKSCMQLTGVLVYS